MITIPHKVLKAAVKTVSSKTALRWQCIFISWDESRAIVSSTDGVCVFVSPDFLVFERDTLPRKDSLAFLSHDLACFDCDVTITQDGSFYRANGKIIEAQDFAPPPLRALLQDYPLVPITEPNPLVMAYGLDISIVSKALSILKTAGIKNALLHDRGDLPAVVAGGSTPSTFVLIAPRELATSREAVTLSCLNVLPELF